MVLNRLCLRLCLCACVWEQSVLLFPSRSDVWLFLACVFSLRSLWLGSTACFSSLTLPVCMYVCLSVCLSVCLPFSLSVSLSVFFSDRKRGRLHTPTRSQRHQDTHMPSFNPIHLTRFPESPHENTTVAEEREREREKFVCLPNSVSLYFCL